jgi:hypothetical protein
MAIAVNTLLTWSRVANIRRAAVVSELMPGGLDDLDQYSQEEIREAIKGFKTLPTVGDRFSLSALTTKRVVQLSLWVKDRVRLGQPVEFENGTTQDVFTAEVEQAQQREQIRKDRKKSADGLSTLKIDPPLKNSAGWEAWIDAIRAALTIAYGSKGVPLLYVIRDHDAPLFVGNDWEELAISAAPLTGLDWEADRKTVHLFITNNVSEDSDAHAYIKSLMIRNNGRLDIRALEERYENEATTQARVNTANKTWELLVYKNERAMTFEDFSKKLTKALLHFERAGRAKHDGDVIDWIWSHVQSSELSQLISALKVGQGIHPRTSRQILQEIAKEIPNISKGSNFQPRISEISQTSTSFTFEGDAPTTGAHTADGKLYCGSYNPNRWFSDDMAAFRPQIISIRESHGAPSGGRGGGRGGGFGGRGGRGGRHQKAKRKLEELKVQNETLSRQLAALQSTENASIPGDTTPVVLPAATTNAGDAFGGRDSMQRRPGSNN